MRATPKLEFECKARIEIAFYDVTFETGDSTSLRFPFAFTGLSS